MPTGTVSDQCTNLLESLKIKLIKLEEVREHLVKLLHFEEYKRLNNNVEDLSNNDHKENKVKAEEELYKFLHKHFNGKFKEQAEAISEAKEAEARSKAEKAEARSKAEEAKNAVTTYFYNELDRAKKQVGLDDKTKSKDHDESKKGEVVPLEEVVKAPEGSDSTTNFIDFLKSKAGEDVPLGKPKKLKELEMLEEGVKLLRHLQELREYEQLNENVEYFSNNGHEENMAEAEEKLYKFLCKSFNGEFKEQAEAISKAQEAEARFKAKEAEAISKAKEAKNAFTSVVKTHLDNEWGRVKAQEGLGDIPKFIKLMKDYGESKEGAVGRLEELEEYVKLIDELKEKFKGLNVLSTYNKDYLEKLQNLEKEMNAFFSERANSGFENAMDYLKKNQKTLRNIAGSLLVIVSIYNIAAVIAGFNAFALMASIATLTSTLPLVLASAEIALVTLAGTSLISYTATSDKVRIACSLKPIVDKGKGADVENELMHQDKKYPC